MVERAHLHVTLHLHCLLCSVLNLEGNYEMYSQQIVNLLRLPALCMHDGAFYSVCLCWPKLFCHKLNRQRRQYQKHITGLKMNRFIRLLLSQYSDIKSICMLSFYVLCFYVTSRKDFPTTILWGLGLCTLSTSFYVFNASYQLWLYKLHYSSWYN
jgi:hypothetical protein